MTLLIHDFVLSYLMMRFHSLGCLWEHGDYRLQGSHWLDTSSDRPLPPTSSKEEAELWDLVLFGPVVFMLSF